MAARLWLGLKRSPPSGVAWPGYGAGDPGAEDVFGVARVPGDEPTKCAADPLRCSKVLKRFFQRIECAWAEQLLAVRAVCISASTKCK